jgi:hypothetical protein
VLLGRSFLIFGGKPVAFSLKNKLCMDVWYGCKESGQIGLKGTEKNYGIFKGPNNRKGKNNSS